MVAGGVVVGGELRRGGMWRVVGAHPLRHGMVHGGMDTTWDRGSTRGGNQKARLERVRKPTSKAQGRPTHPISTVGGGGPTPELASPRGGPLALLDRWVAWGLAGLTRRRFEEEFEEEPPPLSFRVVPVAAPLAASPPKAVRRSWWRSTTTTRSASSCS